MDGANEKGFFKDKPEKVYKQDRTMYLAFFKKVRRSAVNIVSEN